MITTVEMCSAVIVDVFHVVQTDMVSVQERKGAVSVQERTKIIAFVHLPQILLQLGLAEVILKSELTRKIPIGAWKRVYAIPSSEFGSRAFSASTS